MDRMLTVAEVVHRTGLAERTVRAMIADGRLAVVRPEGLRVVRVPAEAVWSLMHSRVEDPAEASVRPRTVG